MAADGFFCLIGVEHYGHLIGFLGEKDRTCTNNSGKKGDVFFHSSAVSWFLNVSFCNLKGTHIVHHPPIAIRYEITKKNSDDRYFLGDMRGAVDQVAGKWQENGPCLDKYMGERLFESNEEAPHPWDMCG
jgi:hypothetical protein